MDRPTKRPKLSPEPPVPEPSVSTTTPLTTLIRSITPPPSRSQSSSHTPKPASTSTPPKLLPSPIQLTHIRDLSASSGNNVDTVRLRDILGDPMIRECWQFNYLIDVDFLMSQFDEDVRSLVAVKVVHGSWKREAPNRIRIDEACARYPNVEAIVAYMPEPFGTHHSKMMILLRHDELAQIVIHTANMIPGDWANMCQAVWRSPLLPLQRSDSRPGVDGVAAVGSGTRFKHDLLAYLNAYGNKKTGPLVHQLSRHDFGAIRAAFVASVPSKAKMSEMDSTKQTLWGWPALKDTLRHVPLKKEEGRSMKPHIVIQISSIASLGQTKKWLNDILFESLCPTSTSQSTPPKYSIIFPTPDEIRRSLNGYGSGGSIHMKLQSAPQQKQLQYMRPYLCQWAGDRDASAVKREAGRRRAAPHIKTYIRFSNADTMDSIDWAMVTSANLSTQAWGAAPNANGEVRICSWETGVIVWPDLFVSAGAESKDQSVKMVPSFKRDLPDKTAVQPNTTVGFRMPYDLPLTPYSIEDVPWCATAIHTEPDWLGQTWEGE